AAFVFFDDFVAVVAGLAVDQLHEDLALVDGHLLELVGELGAEVFFAGFDVGLAFLFIGHEGQVGVYVVDHAAGGHGVGIGNVDGVAEPIPLFHHPGVLGGGAAPDVNIGQGPVRDRVAFIQDGAGDDGVVLSNLNGSGLSVKGNAAGVLGMTQKGQEANQSN